MKKSLTKLSIVLITLIILHPQVTFAAWWNPGTWKIFNRKSDTKQTIVATSTAYKIKRAEITASSTTSKSEDSSLKNNIKSVANLGVEKLSVPTAKETASVASRTSGGGWAGAASGVHPVVPVNCAEYKHLLDSIPNCAIYSDSSSGSSSPAYLFCKKCFPADTSLPLISNIQAVNITKNSATITWDTNELADSKVFYAVYSSSADTYSSPLMNVFDSTHTISHSLNLQNLLEGTSYYYEVHSKRTSGTSANRTRQFFTTLSKN